MKATRNLKKYSKIFLRFNFLSKKNNCETSLEIFCTKKFRVDFLNMGIMKVV